MPTISMFYGILMSIYFEESERHHTQHIHVRYSGYLDVTHVTATDDHKLVLEFENAECRVFNMRPYLAKRLFIPLNDIAIFKLVRVENGTVTWPGDLDIAPDTLHDKSISIPRQ